MSNKQRNYEEELDNLMECVAEYTLDMSDEEIIEEIRGEGADPEEAAEETRNILRKAVKDYKQRKLIEAQKRYDARITALNEKEFSIPDSVEEQRGQLMSLLANNPQMQSSLLTAQYQNFKDIPDSELPGYLRQLHDLGALNDIADAGDEEK